jgi:hypothetical protein
MPKHTPITWLADALTAPGYYESRIAKTPLLTNWRTEVTAQTKAERLADELDAGGNFYAESSTWYDRKLSGAVGQAAAELRRLHALNGELLEALTHVSDWFTAAGIDVPAIQHARAAIAKVEREDV